MNIVDYEDKLCALSLTLVGRAGILRHEVEDVRQSLRSALVAAFRRFVPVGPPAGAFAQVVLRRAAGQIVRERRAKKRFRRRVEALPDHVPSPRNDREQLVDYRIDLADLLARLPADQRDTVAVLFAAGTIAGAARLAGLPRTTFRRRIDGLRAQFEASGLGIYCRTRGHPAAGPPVNTAGNPPTTNSNRRSV